jgi:hypothetical protein
MDDKEKQLLDAAKALIEFDGIFIPNSDDTSEYALNQANKKWNALVDAVRVYGNNNEKSNGRSS